MMTLSEFKKFNKLIGNYWFNKDTRNFFSSKLYSWDCITGLFITSEISPSGLKKYTLRQGNFETGRVKTIGTFFEYSTYGQAKRAWKEAMKEGHNAK